jgi:hypothetical protein
MHPNIILRFRDLVTEPGDTVLEHQAIIRSYNEVWWGWMKRRAETVPRRFLGDNLDVIGREGHIDIFLLDMDLYRMYRCSLVGMAVAPAGTRIGSPEPEKTPEYYNRGRYPAWFLLTSIDELRELPKMFYHSFPTSPEQATLSSLHGTEIPHVSYLRNIDVTLWVVRVVGQL